MLMKAHMEQMESGNMKMMMEKIVKWRRRWKGKWNRNYERRM